MGTARHIACVEIAAEHCRWAMAAGRTARDVVESLINRPAAKHVLITWEDAVTAVAAWSEVMTDLRGAA